ncbi:MAG: TraB domain-containing protein [Candidatus Thorarchaeota archaeon]
MTKGIDRVVFVPVIHTDKESVENARSVVREEKPDVVAVELDHKRYQDLLQKDENEEVSISTGDTVQNFMQQLAILEESIGELMGSAVGSEMLAAIEEGRKIGAKIALVDRPIAATAQALSQVPLDEMYRLTNLAAGAGEEIDGEEAVDLIALLKEDGSVENIMAQFKEEFPVLFRVLITDRDLYLANALHYILGDVKGKIVAVFGAGHIEGVKTALTSLLETNPRD